MLTAPWHALRSACKPAMWWDPKYEITPKGLKRVGVCDEQSFISRLLKKSSIASLITTALVNSENTITDSDLDLYFAIIKEIARISGENNARLIIAHIDATDEQLFHTRWSNESIITELSNIAEVIDVTLADRREDLDSKYFIHQLDQHPSAIANQHRAKILHSLIFN